MCRNCGRAIMAKQRSVAKQDKAKPSRTAPQRAKAVQTAKMAGSATAQGQSKATAAEGKRGGRVKSDGSEPLEKEIAALRKELAASKKREMELQSLVADVSRKLDSVIVLIRGLVKS